MNDPNNQCPICGEGKLHPKVGKNSVDYQGETTELAFYFSVCDACGSEQADAAQTRANKRLMVAFKNRGRVYRPISDDGYAGKGLY